MSLRDGQCDFLCGLVTPAEAHPLKGKVTMFGIFKKKTRKAITEVKKMENRDAVEATVWARIP
ncbi:hypothetical protein ECZC10_54400 [Escherichia coli]|nr:hypothetical protein ECZC10_54400 [Escherichia coli]